MRSRVRNGTRTHRPPPFVPPSPPVRLLFVFSCQVEIVEEVVDGHAMIDGFGTPDDIGNVSVFISSSVSIITC